MNKHTVLVVDDQKINRSILRRILREEYQILEAENGRHALEVLTEQADVISAVVLDIVMPVMDGYGVLRAMRANPALSKIPVIVSSQKEGDEDEEKALELGAQDFIAKPYKANIIRHRLNNTIRFRETAALINRVERDELTGLLSKQFFVEKVADRLQRSPNEELDMMALGIEHFKLVNDTYGMESGDELLRCFAGALAASPEILFSTRFTNDRFFALIPRREGCAKGILARLVEQIHTLPIDMDIKVNCGLYHIEEPETGVVGMCDRALLAAEENKDHFDESFRLYDESMRRKLLEEQFIRSNMCTALEQRQFQVYYQPKYDMTDECIAGAEALVRWIHPTRGFMSPGEFIPLFEHNGFITQLDEYVWETACRDMRGWLDKGYPPVAISVNVSRADVYNPRLTDILLGLAAKYRIPLRCLHLEITESAYTNNPEQIIRVVEKLREIGFVIEMDDFGSGYSSLNMLSEMPVDVLKLDMGFVRHETINTSGKGILSFVISLAKWLDLAVVAEGVETADQIAMLRSMDCNYVQGFYYAKPMKLEDFDTLLKTGRVTEMISKSRTVSEFVELAPQTPPKTAAGGVMLIVDDIEINRAVLVSTFSDWFKIVEKENGAQAWEYLQQNHMHVTMVLLDLLMPVMDGFQLLEKIRADSRMTNLPVIITSQGDAASEQRALEMRADDFISKPYHPEIIRHRVRSVIEVRYLHRMQNEHQILAEEQTVLSDALNGPSGRKRSAALLAVEQLRPYFDIVRLVDPEKTLVCSERTEGCDDCELHSCFTVWGKATRCANCISLCALREKNRRCKLEYTADGLYFVISQYIPYMGQGAVIEMVTKLEEAYVDNVFDRHMLYMRMDEFDHELNVDALTGVFNRRYIIDNLDGMVDSARSTEKNIGIAMIDMDGFKQLNDHYGHLAGDAALRDVAAMLRDNIAQSRGDFAARYGGDEFLIVCRDISQEEFSRRLAAVSKLVQYITAEDGTCIPVSLSTGAVNLSEMPEADAAALVREADRRLYAAKHLRGASALARAKPGAEQAANHKDNDVY